MNIKFAISTNKDFVNTTIPVCINSLVQAGVPKDDIYVFEGGGHSHYQLFDEYEYPGQKNIHKHFIIKENAMDYNAFIGVLNWNLEADYWFMLHDTCTVEKGFYEAVKALKIDSPVVALCKEGLSMNIGLYSKEYLKSNEEFIKSFGNWTNKSELKKHMVATEDALLNKYKSTSHMCKNNPVVSEPYDIYGNGTIRIKVCYDIGLCKTKANWEPKENYELNL